MTNESEQALAWSLENDDMSYWNWGLFGIKEDLPWGEQDQDDIIVESPMISRGFRYPADTHQHPVRMYRCWSCEKQSVHPDDDLGLCEMCIDDLKYPEKLHPNDSPWNYVSRRTAVVRRQVAVEGWVEGTAAFRVQLTSTQAQYFGLAREVDASGEGKSGLSDETSGSSGGRPESDPSGGGLSDGEAPD